jgi:hypothetical protein
MRTRCNWLNQPDAALLSVEGGFASSASTGGSGSGLLRLFRLFRLAAEVDADRAVGSAVQGQPWAIQFQGAGSQTPKQHGAERQRHFRARDFDVALAAGVGQPDVGEAQVKRAIDAEPEPLPDQRGGANRQLCGSASGVGGGFQAAGDVDRSLRQPPGGSGEQGGQDYGRAEHEGGQAVQYQPHAARGAVHHGDKPSPAARERMPRSGR